MAKTYKSEKKTAARIEAAFKTKKATKKARKETLAKARAAKANKSRTSDINIIEENPPKSPSPRVPPSTLRGTVKFPVSYVPLPKTKKRRTTKAELSKLLENFQPANRDLDKLKAEIARNRARVRAWRYRARRKIKKINAQIREHKKEWEWSVLHYESCRAGLGISWCRSPAAIVASAMKATVLPRKPYPKRKKRRLTRTGKARRFEKMRRHQRRMFISQFTRRHYASDKYYREAMLIENQNRAGFFDYELEKALTALSWIEPIWLEQYDPCVWDDGWRRASMLEIGERNGVLGVDRKLWREPYYNK